jgi:hypothetical protein
MAIRNDDGRAELAARLDQLYGIVDESPLLGLDEADREDIIQSIASEMEEEYSPFARLGRAEAAGNAGTGLGAYDPARIGGGYSFEPIVMGREEYMRVGAALAEAVRDVDADVFDMEDELADRAAFAMVGRGYQRPGADREEAFMVDPELHASFADAWEKARAVYLENVPEAANIVVPEEKPRPSMPREAPAEKKGFIARHRKAIGIGIAGLFAAAAGFGIYTVMNNTPRNRFIDSAKAKGYSEADAGRTWDDIQKAVSNDGRISAKDAVTTDTANSMLGLGYVGNYATATRQAVANLTAAYRLGLPKLDSTSMRAITNATQLDGDIVNFQPIKVKDTNGNDVLVGSTNVQRDFWLIANLLGRYTELAKHPEKHEWINEMVKQVAYDGMYGASGVTDDFLKVLYGFNEYMDALPARMQTDGLGEYIALHYLDSAKLKAEIPDRTNRTIALMYLAAIPGSTTENMKKFVDGLGPKYEELKNGFLSEEKTESKWDWNTNSWIKVTKRQAAIDDYHYWIADRHNNGLNNTIKQYIGLSQDESLGHTDEEFDKQCEDASRYGFNQELNKNWGKPWDMIKFIKGYDTHTVGEVDSYRYSMPLSFKSMGVPYGRFLALPYISGTSLDEWAVSVPTSVLNAVKADMGNQKIVSGYGNMVSLYSCVDGAQKDGITMITQSMSTGKGDPILWKK